MPTISHRSKEIEASPIRSLLPFARKAIASGKKIYHLNIGQPDIETPPHAIEHIKGLDDNVIKYGPSEGLTALREIVASYYDKFGATLKKEHVMVTTGASEAILFALLSACDNHSEVIIPEPFYANYLGFAHVTNVDIIPITSDFDEAFALPAPELFESYITKKTKAIFLCNPGNPTGQLYSEEELQSLVTIAKRYDLFLIVDEVYREFCYDRKFTSVLSMPDVEEHIIVVDSISKVFSSCGARVGFLITRNVDILEMVNKYAQLRLCPPYFGQQLAIQCYLEADEYIARAKSAYRIRRALLHERLSQIPGVRTYLPAAAFYNIAELPVDNAEAFCKWLLTDFEMDGHTVMLAPANGFYFNQSIGKKQVRIAYILNKNDLNHAMDILEEGLKVYSRQREMVFAGGK